MNLDLGEKYIEWLYQKYPNFFGRLYSDVFFTRYINGNWTLIEPLATTYPYHYLHIPADRPPLLMLTGIDPKQAKAMLIKSDTRNGPIFLLVTGTTSHVYGDVSLDDARILVDMVAQWSKFPHSAITLRPLTEEYKTQIETVVREMQGLEGIEEAPSDKQLEEINLPEVDRDGVIELDLTNYPETWEISTNTRDVEDFLPFLAKQYTTVCFPPFNDKCKYAWRKSADFFIYYYVDERRFENSCQVESMSVFDACNEEQLLYIPLSIRQIPGVDFNHTNGLIIDIGKRIIERFEPNGCCINLAMDDIDEDLEKHLQTLFPGYEYVPPNVSCPRLFGVQYKESVANKRDGGYCVGWSLLLYHMRLINPNKSLHEISEYMLNKSPEELHTLIRRYSSFIMSHH